jgi:hypothetical protein
MNVLLHAKYLLRALFFLAILGASAWAAGRIGTARR